MSSNKNKLKTLNDLISEEYLIFDADTMNETGCYADYVSPYDLRSCARKWIKELEKYEYSDDKEGFKKMFDRNHFPEGMEDFYYGDSEYVGEFCGNLINWIKHFFNLEDE